VIHACRSGCCRCGRVLKLSSACRAGVNCGGGWRGREHLGHGGADRAAARDDQHVAVEALAHVVQDVPHRARPVGPGGQPLGLEAAGHPLQQRAAQQPEVRAPAFRCLRRRQRLRFEVRCAAQQRGAVVLVQRGPFRGGGQVGQGRGQGLERLALPAQPAAQHALVGDAAVAQPGAEGLALAPAQVAEAVVVVGAEAGLAVADEMKGAQGLAPWRRASARVRGQCRRRRAAPVGRAGGWRRESRTSG
jgi:hypothetical protein